MVSSLLLIAGPLALAALPPPVVGGAPVAQGDRPEVGAVYFGDAVGCTGVLIAPDVALTAAHCDAATAIQLDGVDYTQGGDRIAVDRVVVYPDWETTYDVAVLLLAQESAVQPAALALGCVLDQGLYDGAAVSLVGYGATDRYGNVTTTSLHEAPAQVVDSDCSALERGCREAVSPGGELIAGGDGVDTCIGDSGGPVYLPTDWGDYVVGLTSRAVSDATAYCEGGGIYARPDAVIDWIEAVSGRALPRPDCAPGAIDTAPGGADTGIEQPKGCGCAAGRGAGGGWLLLLLGLSRRRRG